MRRSHGLAMIYTILILMIFFAFASLAVDFGRVQVAKTELRRTADSAAMAAAANLPYGVTSAQNAAVAMATANMVDGSALSLDTTNDIEFGTWNLTTKTFTVLTGSARSGATGIRITARRTSARGTAIPLVFGALIGRSTCDINALSTAYCSGRRAELVGLNGITVQNNFFGGAYNSSTTTSPTHTTITTGAYAASNGAIDAGMNEAVQGVVLGPSGTSNLTTVNAATVLPSNISFPLPTGGTATTDFTISGTMSVPGGTYYANDLTMNNNSVLNFTGVTTLYLSGNVKFQGDATITAYNSIPGNLKIYHTGTGSFGSATANNDTIIADIYAPGVDFAVKNNAILYGRFIFKTITAKNNLDFYYDEALTPTYFSGTVSSVNLVK